MRGEDKNSNSLYFQYHKTGRSLHEKVRFYEEMITRDNTLTYDEKQELTIDYTIALFEIGRYHRFLSKVDEIIEMVVEENIYRYNGADLFSDLLFRKAACFYNVGKYEEAVVLLNQLKKISPEDKIVPKLIRKCTRKIKNDQINYARGIAMILFSGAIVVKLLSIFIVEPFYYQYSSYFGAAFDFLLITGLISWAGNELWHYYRMNQL